MELERGTSVDGAQKSDEVWMELKKATRLGAARRSNEGGCGSKRAMVTRVDGARTSDEGG